MTRDEASGATLYHCGTTTLMIQEGWHCDGRTAAEKARTLAHWRAHLSTTGRTSKDDVGLRFLSALRRIYKEVEKPRPRRRSRARSSA